MCRIYFFCWLLLLFLASCDKDSKPVQQEYITIGAIFPLTGDFCHEGIKALNGLQLARQIINENGKIFGKQLDIIVLDDRNDAEHAIEQYNILKEKGVIAIIGSSFPEITQILAEEAKKDNMPFISPATVNPAKAKVLASFAYDSLNAKTALIIDNLKYDSTTKIFEKEFRLMGGTILGYEDYPNTEDFETILAKYKTNQPDIIFCQTNYIAAAKLVETSYKLGLDKPNFIGTYAWEGILGFLRESKAMEHIYYATPFALDKQDSVTKIFSQEFFINYNQMPNSASALSYSAAQIIVEAIKNANSTEPKSIIDAMNANTPEVVAKHNPPTVYIMRIENNSYSMFKKLKL